MNRKPKIIDEGHREDVRAKIVCMFRREEIEDGVIDAMIIGDGL